MHGEVSFQHSSLARNSETAVRAAAPPSIELLLVFLLGRARFGIRAADVREIVRAVAIAPLPRAPAIVEGVINLRGTIVPVLDVRDRFGLAPNPLHSEQHFVIALAGERLVGLRADRAVELLSVSADAIEPPGKSTPGVAYVAGIARLPDGLVVIHDIDAFLSLDEGWAVDAAVTSAVEPSASTGRSQT